MTAERDPAGTAEEPTVPPAAQDTPPQGQPAEAADADSAEESDTVRLGAAEPSADPAPDTQPDPGAQAPAAPPKARKKSAAGVVIGLLVGLLGFALVVQVRSNATDPTLASARQADLLQILQDLESRNQRLQSDIGDLQELQRELASSAEGNKAALEQAKKRADQLGILAGTLSAEGPGLTVTFARNGEDIRAIDLLDAVQELRNAGAEAMQITGANGVSVRIIVSTYFTDGSGGALTVDGQALTGPYTITAIGDPSTMDKAMRIPGGVVALVTSHGGNVIVGEPGTVKVTTLHAPTTLDYAQPAS